MHQAGGLEQRNPLAGTQSLEVESFTSRDAAVSDHDVSARKITALRKVHTGMRHFCLHS